MFTLLPVLLLGVAHGARHAFEPDHLAAVSTLVVDGAPARRGVWLGAWWGLGHTTSLLAMALALSAANAELPPAIGDRLELVVAAMLVALGVRAVVRAVRGATIPEHRHGRRVHGGPFAVGTVHGLAGSGALFAAAAAALPDVGARLAFVALFGLGSVIGMAALSGLAGAPMARLAAHRRLVCGATGAVTAALGVGWGLPLLR